MARIIWIISLVFVAAVFYGGSAAACMMVATRDLNDVSYADVVVTGRILNYRIVEDAEARERRKRMLERSPALRKLISEDSGYLSEYAKFDIEVDEVLRGTASGIIAATWNNSTFGEPKEMPDGSFLIALRSSTLAIPPLRGPSATILPDPEPNLYAVLQAPCAGPFIFESNSNDATAVRQILTEDQE